MINQYGINEEIWQNILKTCFSYPHVVGIRLYGSRARGDYRESSDIDLAIDAPFMTDKEFSALWNALDDLPIVFSLDSVHLQSLQNESLLRAIEEDGVSISNPNSHTKINAS